MFSLIDDIVRPNHIPKQPNTHVFHLIGEIEALQKDLAGCCGDKEAEGSQSAKSFRATARRRADERRDEREEQSR